MFPPTQARVIMYIIYIMYSCQKTFMPHSGSILLTDIVCFGATLRILNEDENRHVQVDKSSHCEATLATEGCVPPSPDVSTVMLP